MKKYWMESKSERKNKREGTLQRSHALFYWLKYGCK
jgi:hypothetical protein